jgi:hypothetical protein
LAEDVGFLHFQFTAKSVRRSAQDDDFVGVWAKNIPQLGQRFWDGILGLVAHSGLPKGR